MAGTSLLTLIDDIAIILDDVAILSKVAAKKTAGVLGDDLALNAQQVTGVKADRELPVVWAVAKGSFVNKLILVPSALLISVVAPWLITPLLMIGGAYLCYEGAEKIFHKLTEDKAAQEKKHQETLAALADPNVDMLEYENDKIKGAIRTDFILSAEIVVIALGTVQSETFAMQSAVISTIALLMTVGVYSLVAGIVKLDDAGLHLVEKSKQSPGTGFSYSFNKIVGKGLLSFAPKLMKTLSVVGTIAMFLVGGGILVHGTPFVHHFLEVTVESAHNLPTIGNIVSSVTPSFINMIFGGLVGVLVLVAEVLINKLRK